MRGALGRVIFAMDVITPGAQPVYVISAAAAGIHPQDGALSVRLGECERLFRCEH